MTYKIFVAVKGFIEFNGKVLLIRESSKYADATAKNKGKYNDVGGRVEPGERFDEGLLREIKEETGLDVQIGKPFFVNEWRPEVRGEKWQIVGTYFECTTKSNEVILSNDRSDYIWIDPKNYAQYDIVENLIPTFEAYLRRNNK